MKADDAPQTVELMLKEYLSNRGSADESFLTFTRRHEIDALKSLFAGEAVE